MAKYFMGIDAGTGSVRVAIFDEKGHMTAYDVKEYPSYYPKSGWAEQNDRDWWNALKEAIPVCIRKSGVKPEEIVGISCDGTSSTTIFLDKDGNSVRTPILWMDVRASEEAQSISELAKDCDALKFYRSGVPAESLIPKCMWVKRTNRKTGTRPLLFLNSQAGSIGSYQGKRQQICLWRPSAGYMMIKMVDIRWIYIGRLDLKMSWRNFRQIF